MDFLPERLHRCNIQACSPDVSVGRVFSLKLNLKFSCPMGFLFQDMDVTSCFDLQASSNRIFLFEISHCCDPRGLCQEDVPGNPLVGLLELTDPLGKPGMRVVLQEPGSRSGAALRCFLWAVLSLTCFLYCIMLFQPSERRLTGVLHRFKMLLLGKGVILFLCVSCCDCGCEISGSPHTWQKIIVFMGLFFSWI